MPTVTSDVFQSSVGHTRRMTSGLSTLHSTPSPHQLPREPAPLFRTGPHQQLRLPPRKSSASSLSIYALKRTEVARPLSPLLSSQATPQLLVRFAVLSHPQYPLRFILVSRTRCCKYLLPSKMLLPPPLQISCIIVRFRIICLATEQPLQLP
jgi:hypothetical protein